MDKRARDLVRAGSKFDVLAGDRQVRRGIERAASDRR
jgi:hypothetical protein